MRILITGGYGFFGYHLALSLKNLNCEILLVDIVPLEKFDKEFNRLLLNKNIEYVRLDLTNSNELKSLDRNFTHIIHLAAILGVENVINNPYKVLSRNICMLDNIINFAIGTISKSTLLFASTSEVYAGTLFNSKLKFPTPEDSLLILPSLTSPRTSYMLSKIYGEALCFASKLKTIILRPHNLYGPRMGMKHVIPQLIKKIHNTEINGEIGVFSPNHKRTFCFINDAVLQVKALIEKEQNKDSLVFNLGNQNDEITMKELSLLLIKIMDRKDLNVKELGNTLGSPERRCPLTSDLDAYTSIYKRTNIIKGIEETYNWYIKEKNSYLD